ncbi:MAG: copper resistance protein B [Deltaproteobacteria bacterium]|nr:MAG: copper resistance protein B [Deltaproteobacteria bacterium]
MKKMLFVLLLSLLAGRSVYAGEMIDDPLLGRVLVDQLEIRTGDGDDPVAWDAEGWLGYDINKLWIKTEGDYVDGQSKEAELQALYSRAIAPFWDLQIGWRGDIRPNPSRNWLALGVKGLAPYFFDIDVALFIGDAGRTSMRLSAEYEIMLTQRIILVPDIELNLYGRDDAAVGIGSGLSSIETGLRLRYEIRREFAPYIGLNRTRLYGETADFARAEAGDTDDVRLVFGIRFWF